MNTTEDIKHGSKKQEQPERRVKCFSNTNISQIHQSDTASPQDAMVAAANNLNQTQQQQIGEQRYNDIVRLKEIFKYTATLPRVQASTDETNPPIGTTPPVVTTENNKDNTNNTTEEENIAESEEIERETICITPNMGIVPVVVTHYAERWIICHQKW